MRIEQRHVTIIDLHDGKSRCFLLRPEDHGYRLTAVSRDDVLHLYCSGPDLQRLRTEVLRAAPLANSTVENGATIHETHPTTEEPTSTYRSLVRVDHRHVTTVSLQHGKEHDFAVRPDDRGYKVTCFIRDEAINLLLPVCDLASLAAVLRGRAGASEPAETPDPHLTPAQPAKVRPRGREVPTEWIAYN